MPALKNLPNLPSNVYAEIADSPAYKREPVPETRCFRFDNEGRAEYAQYQDLINGNPSPRWYGHQLNKSDFDFE